MHCSKSLSFLLSIVFILARTSLAQQPEPDCSGTWRLQSDSSVKFVIAQKDGKIRFTEVKGSETKADYGCKTDGKECKVKAGGHPAKVSFWFNGAKLVQLETRGNNVIRRRFELANKGDTLKVEFTSIVPEGKDEELTFSREKL